MGVVALVLSFQGTMTTPAGPSLPVAAMAETAPGLPIYDDHLAAGWSDWSWDSSVAFDDSTTAYSGRRTIAFRARRGWAGLRLHSSSALDAAHYASLTFAARAGQAGQRYAVVAFDENGSIVGPATELTEYGELPSADWWTVYTVPLAHLLRGRPSFTGFALQSLSDGPQLTFYLDDIRLLGPESTPASVREPRPADLDAARASQPNAANRGFVTTRGTEFYADGAPFRFLGFNLFDAAGRPDGYRCAWWDALTDDDLDAALGRMRAEAGATVLRFWAFQSYTSGGTDWAGIDRVVRLAKKHEMRVMPVLENGLQHCTVGSARGDDGGKWYSKAHRRDYRYGYPLSLPEYAERIVLRYRDDPTILGWTIMNEAETDNVAGMHEFAREITTLVKRLDPNHLITLGTQSSGQGGARGPDFLAIYGLPTIDFVTGHDWDRWGDDREPLPGSPDGRTLPDAHACTNYRAIGCSIAQTLRALNKPFVIGEAGIKIAPSGSHTPQQRAALLEAKIAAALSNGVGGYLVWQWNGIVDEGYDVLRNDPVLAVMRRYASLPSARLPVGSPGPISPGQPRLDSGSTSISSSPPDRQAPVPNLTVVNTGRGGLWIRQAPGGQGVRTWPDGTQMVALGQQQVVAGVTWVAVRAPDGVEGWTAAEFLSGPAPAASHVAASPAPAPTPSGFVTRRGTSFFLDGAPFRFVGANMYNAAGDPAVYECGSRLADPERELDDWFSRARNESGARVVRFWAFQSYSAGGTDWRALDRVMRIANRHGMKVIPVLENHWGDCTQGGDKAADWYAGGYRRPYGSYPLSYEAYVRRVVERYRDEPAVFAWMLMNEPESRQADGRPMPDVLFRFAQEMTGLVKAQDARHLVALGAVGDERSGLTGRDLDALHELASIDLIDYHDYGADDEALPGAPLVPAAPLRMAIYAQDRDWSWREQPIGRQAARTWQTWTSAIPPGVAPFRQIGIQVPRHFVGSVYLDQIQIGARVYDFEDGSTQGWRSAGPAALTNADAVAAEGRRSLRVTFSASAGAAQIWLPADPTDMAGTPISVRVYADTSGAIDANHTLAVAMKKARQLNKPLLVGEAGIAACNANVGSHEQTTVSRARKFDAKLGAFFGEGGAGYLIWLWEPKPNCGHAFTTGDPLNAVLTRHAAAFRPR